MNSNVDLDYKENELPPRWPPPLTKGSFQDPSYEVMAVDATSISYVLNRIVKVRARGKPRLISGRFHSDHRQEG